ncbi:High mobility group box 1 [Coemansia nantahalensis]|nr:High mobility group box 1 [Coemansia nantahalensis]
MLRILGSLSKLAASRAAIPARAFSASAGCYVAAAKKTAPARKASTAGRAKSAPKPKPRKAAAKAKPKKAAAKAKPKKAKKAPAPKKAKAKKGPTKAELLEALIKAPPKPASPYALFVKSVAVTVPAGQPSSIAERSRQYAEKWRKLTDAEKASFQDKARAARAEYEAAARAWWQSADPKLVALENRRRKRQRGPKALLLKNPFAPKRPASGYIMFATEQTELNKHTVPSGIGGMASLMSAVAARWNAMSVSDKEPFARKAAADKIRYQQELKEYYGRAVAAA